MRAFLTAPVAGGSGPPPLPVSPALPAALISGSYLTSFDPKQFRLAPTPAGASRRASSSSAGASRKKIGTDAPRKKIGADEAPAAEASSSSAGAAEDRGSVSAPAPAAAASSSSAGAAEDRGSASAPAPAAAASSSSAGASRRRLVLTRHQQRRPHLLPLERRRTKAARQLRHQQRRPHLLPLERRRTEGSASAPAPAAAASSSSAGRVEEEDWVDSFVVIRGDDEM